MFLAGIQANSDWTPIIHSRVTAGAKKLSPLFVFFVMISFDLSWERALNKIESEVARETL